MVLAIDIENSTITIGCMGEEKIYFVERFSSDTGKTDFEYTIKFKNLFDIYNIDIKNIEGTIISSVVPPLVEIIKSAVKKIIKNPIKVIGPGIKTGLNILMDNPAQLGSDLVANAVAALKYYTPPVLVIVMGTATTISVLDKNGNYVGGIIMPGLETALDGLTRKTAQLPKISLKAPKKIIGTNTIDSMKSGVINGMASSIDGLIDGIENEMGIETTRVATGIYASKIIPYCKKKLKIDSTLSLKGLRIIFDKNR